MDLKVAHVAIFSPPVIVLYFGRSLAKSGRGKQSVQFLIQKLGNCSYFKKSVYYISVLFVIICVFTMVAIVIY